VLLCVGGAIGLGLIGKHSKDNTDNGKDTPGVSAPANPGNEGSVTTPPDNGDEGSVTTPPDDNGGQAGTTAEQQYIAAERQSGKFSTSSTDQQLLTAGYDVCGAFRAGASLQDVGEAGSKAGLTTEQTSYLVAGAVIYLCPDQKDKIPNN
jgi:hypothetical protein